MVYWRSLGFTLSELLVVLLLLGVMLLMASPSWQAMAETNQVDAIVDPLVAAIRFTRRSAISAGENTILCGSANKNTCDGSWNMGQIVTKDSGEVLRRFAAVPKAYQLLWRSSLSRDDRLVFTAEGFTAGQQGSFYICSRDATSTQGKRVVISSTGRLRISDGCQLS